jgi:hypothetical protein
MRCRAGAGVGDAERAIVIDSGWSASFRIFGRSLTPYGSVEVYYDTRFDVWNRNRLTAGAEFQLKRGFPLLRELTPRKQVILDFYYTKQNDSRSQPNHVHAIGASVGLHF